MVAVPAAAILRQETPRPIVQVRAQALAYVMPVLISQDGCPAGPSRDTPVTLEPIRARLDWQPPTIEVRAEPAVSDMVLPRALLRGCRANPSPLHCSRGVTA